MMRTTLAATLILATMVAFAQPLGAQGAQQDDERRRSAREMAAEIARLVRALDRPQRFRVVLIVSSTMAEPPSDGIPTDARKALEDMKAFLPFKSYRLFGTGEVDARRGEPAALRISGGDNQTFEITIARDAPSLVNRNDASRSTPDPRLSLSFMLRDVSGITLRDARGTSPGPPLVVSEPSINTLVAMDVGETIVVGTSRVRGSRGLLALLTALPYSEK
jgi:hypothetical protein